MLTIIAAINKIFETIPEKGPFFRLSKSNSEIFQIKSINPTIITMYAHVCLVILFSLEIPIFLFFITIYEWQRLGYEQ